jgi:acyl carrier protein
MTTAQKNGHDIAEHVLRKYLIGVQSTEPLDDEISLRSLGLDSMKSISLMLELESELGVMIPDQYLIPESYETLRALRAMIDEVTRLR